MNYQLVLLLLAQMFTGGYCIGQEFSLKIGNTEIPIVKQGKSQMPNQLAIPDWGGDGDRTLRAIEGGVDRDYFISKYELPIGVYRELEQFVARTQGDDARLDSVEEVLDSLKKTLRSEKTIKEFDEDISRIKNDDLMPIVGLSGELALEIASAANQLLNTDRRGFVKWKASIPTQIEWQLSRCGGDGKLDEFPGWDENSLRLRLKDKDPGLFQEYSDLVYYLVFKELPQENDVERNRVKFSYSEVLKVLRSFRSKSGNTYDKSLDEKVILAGVKNSPAGQTPKGIKPPVLSVPIKVLKLGLQSESSDRELPFAMASPKYSLKELQPVNADSSILSSSLGIAHLIGNVPEWVVDESGMPGMLMGGGIRDESKQWEFCLAAKHRNKENAKQEFAGVRLVFRPEYDSQAGLQTIAETLRSKRTGGNDYEQSIKNIQNAAAELKLIAPEEFKLAEPFLALALGTNAFSETAAGLAIATRNDPNQAQIWTDLQFIEANE